MKKFVTLKVEKLEVVRDSDQRHKTMKRTYVEMTCDGCGSACHYVPPRVDDEARADGWLIIGRKHYCDEKCKEKAERAAAASNACMSESPTNDADRESGTASANGDSLHADVQCERPTTKL